MPDSFTAYWNKARVDIISGRLDTPIPFLCGGPHLSQPCFLRAGVKPGDIVYPITLRGAQIHILASFTVDRIVPVEDFIQNHEELYPLSERASHSAETLEAAGRRIPWHRAICWTCTDHVLVPSISSKIRCEEAGQREGGKAGQVFHDRKITFETSDP